ERDGCDAPRRPAEADRPGRAGRHGHGVRAPPRVDRRANPVLRRVHGPAACSRVVRSVAIAREMSAFTARVRRGAHRPPALPRGPPRTSGSPPRAGGTAATGSRARRARRGSARPAETPRSGPEHVMPAIGARSAPVAIGWGRGWRPRGGGEGGGGG